MPFGDQPSSGLGRRFRRRGAQLLDRCALFGRDLVLGHAGAALDQCLGVGPRLRDDFISLVPRTLEQRFAVLVGRRSLGLILGLERLGFLAQRFCLGELVADELDLVVERLGDRRQAPSSRS